jgi:hypothetical protein
LNSFKYNQQYATLHNILCAVNARHVSGGFYAHHQELKTVHTTAREDEIYLDKEIIMLLCVSFCFRMMATSLRLLTVLYAVSVTLLVFWYTRPEISHPVAGRNRTAVRQIIPEPFDGFNNETGTENGTYLVPIIHFLRFKQNNFTFVDAVCVLSAFKNHRPDKILFHTDVDSVVGPYWEKVKNTPGIVYEFRNVILQIQFSDRISVNIFTFGTRVM